MKKKANALKTDLEIEMILVKRRDSIFFNDE